MKNKFLITGLATATLLSTAALTQLSPSVYAAEPTTEQPNAKKDQDEILANFDKALAETIKELEEEAKNDPDSAESIKNTIAKLKEEAAKERAKIEDGFKTGKTAEATENEIKEIAKAEEEKEKAEAEAEKAAQDEFLANYDKALEEAVKELEKAETNSPEEAKAKADTIAALKAASDQTRAAIVEGFKKGLTAKQAEVFIDELNKKAAAEDKEATSKKAEGTTKIESSNGQNATINEVPEFNEPLTGHFDIADLGNPNAEAIEEGEVGESKPKEIKGYKFVRTVKDGNVTKHYYKKLNTPASAEIPTPDFPIPAKVGTPGNPPRENSDTKAVNEPALVPTTPAAPGTDASATSTAETPATPAVAPTVAGTNKDNTYQAPAAKAEDKKELPNTGGKDNVAVASLGFLGLLLGALPFVKRKN